MSNENFLVNTKNFKLEEICYVDTYCCYHYGIYNEKEEKEEKEEKHLFRSDEIIEILEKNGINIPDHFEKEVKKQLWKKK